MNASDDHVHGHGDTHGHGTRRDYLIGFALSAVLTAAPFWLVMTGALGDPRVTAAIRQRQQRYLSVSVPVTVEQVQRWSFATRLVQNAVAMMSPVL